MSASHPKETSWPRRRRWHSSLPTCCPNVRSVISFWVSFREEGVAFTNEPRNLMADQSAAAWPFATQLVDVNPVRATVALAVLLAVLALVLRLYGLSDKPLWFDEIITLNRTNLPLAELVIDALKNKHYPTYFLLLSPFSSANIDAWTLRIPSALFGAACTFLVTRLAAEIRGPQAGLVAGLLMALSPFEVQYGQEARSYTLVSCLVLIAIWGLVRIARTPVASALPVSRPAAQRGAWAAYLLGTLGALLLHNCAVPWFLASNMALLVIAHRAPFERRDCCEIGHGRRPSSCFSGSRA